MEPQLGGVASAVRGELLNAGKAAATAVVNNRIESLSESLHQRTEALRAVGGSIGSRGRPADDEGPRGGDEESSGQRANAEDEDEEPEDSYAGDEDEEPEDSYAGDEDEEPEDSYAGDEDEEPEDSYAGDEDEEPEDSYAEDEDEADDETGGSGRRRQVRQRRSPVTRAGR